MRRQEGIDHARQRRFCLFTIALALGEPGSVSGKQVVIATIGDFLTLGEESSSSLNLGDAGPSTGYPAVLAARLGAEARILNFGVHRATMRGGGIVSYSNSMQSLKAAESNPDAVLIMLGTNDARVGYWDKREFMKGAQKLIQDFKKLATRPFIAVLQPPPLYKDGISSMSQHVVNDLIGTFLPQAVAASGGSVVYSKGVFDALGGSGLSCQKCFYAAGHVNDGCHPSDYGYQRIAEAVYALLVGRGILTGLAQAASDPSTTTSTMEITTSTMTTTTLPPTTATITPTTVTETSTKTQDNLDALMVMGTLPLMDADIGTSTTERTGSVCPLDVNCTAACCTAPGYGCVRLNAWWARCKKVQTKPHAAVADGECSKYMATIGCSWTAQFSCPGQQPGSDGTSSDDGTLGYRCCCAKGMWKDGFASQEPEPTPSPGPIQPGGALPPLSPSPGATTSRSPIPGPQLPSPIPGPPGPLPGLSMHLPQGIPQSLAEKLAKKARREFGGDAVVDQLASDQVRGESGGEVVAEDQAFEKAVPLVQHSPAQADERQGRQDRGEVAQEKLLVPDSKESKPSSAQKSFEDFCTLVASLAVPIGSGLLPCTAGAFLLYQAMKRTGFIQVPQDPVGDLNGRRYGYGSKRHRSGRRY